MLIYFLRQRAQQRWHVTLSRPTPVFCMSWHHAMVRILAHPMMRVVPVIAGFTTSARVAQELAGNLSCSLLCGGAESGRESRHIQGEHRDDLLHNIRGKRGALA